MFLIEPSNSSSLILQSYVADVTIASGATFGSATLPQSLNSGAFTTVHYLGARSTTATMTFDTCGVIVNLPNQTSVGAATTSNTTASIIASCQRIDWNPVYVKRVQYFQISMGGTTTGTATLSNAVVTANSCILWTGTRNNQATRDYSNWGSTLSLTSTTQVTATRVGSTGTTIIEGWVVEFYPGVLNQAVQEVEATIASGGTAATAACTSTPSTSTITLNYGFRCQSTSSNLIQGSHFNAAGNTIINVSNNGTTLTQTCTQRVGIVAFKESFVATIPQNNTIGDVGGTVGTVTIPTANLDKTILVFMGQKSFQNDNSMQTGYCNLNFANATTVQTTRASTGSGQSNDVRATTLNFL